MAMTAAQALVEKGRIEKAQEIVLSLLRKRFGEVPPLLRDRIGHLQEQQLSDLTLDLLDFAGVADAESWIGARSTN